MSVELHGNTGDFTVSQLWFKKKKILACAVIENKCPTINTSSDNEIKEAQDRQWFSV
jgi:hypothetical protein